MRDDILTFKRKMSIVIMIISNTINTLLPFHPTAMFSFNRTYFREFTYFSFFVVFIETNYCNYMKRNVSIHFHNQYHI